MSGTKGYGHHKPNNKRGRLVLLFRDQCQSGKEKSQESLVGWTGRSPCIFPWKVLCIFRLVLGLQTCSPLLHVMSSSRMLWVLPLVKTQLLFLVNVHMCLCVLELWGKALIRHTIVPQPVRRRGFCCWPDSVAGSSGVCVETFLPFFVLEEEAGKGLTLFRVGEQQLLAWVGPGWGF